jgi:translation elongation factor P/translation initiation factor 5A
MFRFLQMQSRSVHLQRHVAARSTLTPAINSFANRDRRSYARISASELKVGNLINLEDKLFTVNSAQFTRKAQGRPFIQLELTSFVGKKKREHRFRSDEDVEVADTDRLDLHFVGASAGDDDMLEFRDASDEIVLVRKDIVGDCWRYLTANRDDEKVVVLRYEEKFLTAQLPPTVTVSDRCRMPFACAHAFR